MPVVNEKSILWKKYGRFVEEESLIL